MEQPPKKDRKINVVKLSQLVQLNYTAAQKRYADAWKEYASVNASFVSYMSAETKGMYRLARFNAKSNLLIGMLLLSASILSFVVMLFGKQPGWLQIILGVVCGSSAVLASPYINKVWGFLTFKRDYFKKISDLRRKVRELKKDIPKNGQPPQLPYKP